jgi:outer membrane cobalamin receptor
MESQSSGMPDTDTQTLSYWLQDQLFIGENLVLIAGARMDDHQSFGRKTTFRIAPAYEIFSTGTRLKASFGTGFRSPSLYELYSVYGNPDLEPEKSQGWDLGVEQGFLDDLLTLGVTYWEMVLKTASIMTCSSQNTISLKETPKPGGWKCQLPGHRSRICFLTSIIPIPIHKTPKATPWSDALKTRWD